MVKLHYALRRREDLSPEALRRYWRETHGPLVRGHAEALGIVRYVQSHALSTPLNDALRQSRGAEAPYDGVAELWWPSPEALARALETDAGRAAATELLEDERRFVDLARSSLVLTEERPVVGGGSAAGEPGRG